MSSIFVQIFVVFWYYILVRLHLYVSQDMYLVRLRWNICTIWYIYIYIYNRRKFRSQTSDSMDRWKSRGGKSQRREEQKREDQRRERARRKKMQVREKVAKSRNICVFPMICGSGGSKVGSLKRVRSHVASWDMKSCTPLCREARLEVKMYKTHQGRTTFGSWDVEKVHAVVARSTFPSQILTKHTSFGAFWKLRCRKSARCCGAKHISKSKCLETRHARTTFEGSDVVLRGRCKGFCIVSKVSKTWGFFSISKNDGRRGTFEEDLERCIFRGRQY